MNGPRSQDLDLVVVPDAEAAAAAAAALLVEVALAGGSIVLAGGSTPRRAYELAAQTHADWSRVDLWFGDDRCVPAVDPRSNQHLVNETLVDRVDHPPVVHPIATDRTPAEAAAAYDEALRGVALDLVLLGLGNDGHTASLFPNADSLAVRDRLAVEEPEPRLAPFIARVTLTIPALEAGAHVVFLAVGDGKAEPARRAFGEPPAPQTPASLVRSRHGTTMVILDEAAAALL